MANIPSKNHPWRRDPLSPPSKPFKMPEGIGLSPEQVKTLSAASKNAADQVQAQNAAASAALKARMNQTDLTK